MKNSFFLIITLLSLIFCVSTSAARLKIKSIKDLVSEYPVIVTGKLVEVETEGKVTTAHLVISKVLKNHTDSFILSGDFIEFRVITIPSSDDRQPKGSGYTKGQEGIWFLSYNKTKKTFKATTQYSLKPMKDLDEITKEISLLPAPPKKTSPISIALAIPKSGRTHSITCWHENSHFHVVLRNNSDKPIKLFQEWNSWGYFNLSFVIKDETGKEHIMKKKMRAWGKNAPTTLTIDPGDMHVIDVKYHGTDWEGALFPDNSKNDIKMRRGRFSPIYTIKAVYTIRESDDAKRLGVWAGRIESAEKKVSVYK